MHAPATPEAEGMLMEKHFRLMKKTAIFINTGRGPTVQEVRADQGAAGGMDRPCRPGRARDRAAGQQQSDPRHAECHAERAYRICVRAIRSGAQAACRARTGGGSQRQMADELCQSGCADEFDACAVGSRFQWNVARTVEERSPRFVLIADRRVAYRSATRSGAGMNVGCRLSEPNAPG